jgi:mRNA interferase RelE/StbE
MTISYKVVFAKSARKEWEKLPVSAQDKVIDAVRLLALNPFTELLQIKKIKGAEALYRIRLGDYRVVYEVKNDVLVILVIKIGHRKDVYRGFQ